jgi:hypothetical protein
VEAAGVVVVVDDLKDIQTVTYSAGAYTRFGFSSTQALVSTVYPN